VSGEFTVDEKLSFSNDYELRFPGDVGPQPDGCVVPVLGLGVQAEDFCKSLGDGNVIS
jgi:hypothetical protein